MYCRLRIIRPFVLEKLPEINGKSGTGKADQESRNQPGRRHRHTGTQARRREKREQTKVEASRCMAWKESGETIKKKERGRHWPPKGNADRVHFTSAVLTVCMSCAAEMYPSGNSFLLPLNDDKRNGVRVL